MKNIFIICTIRSATPQYLEMLETYVAKLESDGYIVYAPHRDTNQNALGYEICLQNMSAIKCADEVHIFYNPNSQGTHFDMGVAFALNKKIKIIQNEPLTEGKSFQRMLVEWEDKNKLVQYKYKCDRCKLEHVLDESKVKNKQYYILPSGCFSGDYYIDLYYWFPCDCGRVIEVKEDHLMFPHKVEKDYSNNNGRCILAENNY